MLRTQQQGAWAGLNVQAIDSWRAVEHRASTGCLRSGARPILHPTKRMAERVCLNRNGHAQQEVRRGCACGGSSGLLSARTLLGEPLLLHAQQPSVAHRVWRVSGCAGEERAQPARGGGGALLQRQAHRAHGARPGAAPAHRKPHRLAAPLCAAGAPPACCGQICLHTCSSSSPRVPCGASRGPYHCVPGASQRVWM